MNEQLTEIAFLLDRSGSMSRMTEIAIRGFNDFIREQQESPGEARLTLALFNNAYEETRSSVPVGEVEGLDSCTFRPHGNTALLDAIGRGIDELGARLAAMPEAERPGQVIVAILTDGLENASRRFSWSDIEQKIRHQEQCYSWRFLFLGANQDAIAIGARVGVSSTNSATFTDDATGHSSSWKTMSRKVRAIRSSKLDANPHPDLDRPMRDILREEDDSSRGE